MHQTSLWVPWVDINAAFREMVSLEAGSGQNHGFQVEPWLWFGEESRPKREEVESGPHSNMHQTRLPMGAWGRYTNAAFREMVSLEAGSGQNRGFQDEPWLRF